VPDTRTARLDTQLSEFFETFSRASNTLDADALAGCFEEVFLAADATGARAVPRAIFLRALPMRQQMAEVAGIGPAVLSSLTHQDIDEHYVLARTEWTAPSTTGGDAVQLCSSFLLHRDDDGLRIVCYLTHQGLPQLTAAARA
jgi:hypothetical protein